MRTEAQYLADMIQAANAVSIYIDGVTFDQFTSERMRQSAVTHELQIIGEAVSRISKELKARHSEIPWAQIVAFRNIVIHEYFGVDLEIVWHSASYDAPIIKGLIMNMLQSEFPDAYRDIFGSDF